MAKRTSEFGFAYVFDTSVEAFNDLCGHFNGIQMTVTLEREDLQICKLYEYRPKIAQKATLVFELWTGDVLKTKRPQYGIEVLIQGHDKLRHLDSAEVFGAMRYQTASSINWYRQASEREYLACAELGYKLPPIPNSAMTAYSGEESPNLAILLLEEIEDYYQKAKALRTRLQFAAPTTVLHDLGVMLCSRLG